MIHRETYEFDLRVVDEMDVPEYQSLARLLKEKLESDGETMVLIGHNGEGVMTLAITTVRQP